MIKKENKLRYTPLSVFVWTWVLYLVAYLFLAPFDYGRSLGLEAIGLLALCLLAFVGGCWQVGFNQPAIRALNASLDGRQKRAFDRLVAFCAMAGAIGTGMIVVDKVASGQVSISKSIGEVRLDQMLGTTAGQGSPLLIVGMATYSFSNVAVILYMLRGEVCSRWTGRWICVCWFSPALIVLIYGGRSSAVLMLLQVVGAGWIRRARGESFLPRAYYLRRLLAVYGVLVLVGFLYIFASRAAAFGDRTSSELVYGFSDTADAAISPDVLRFLDDAGFLGDVASTVMMTAAYVTHSLPEMDYLLVENSDAGPYWGGYQFGFLFKAVSLLTGIDVGVSDIAEDVHHEGWFFTAWGAMYLDVGYWGTGVMLFLLGTLARIAYVQAVFRGSMAACLVLVQIYVYLLGSPIHSSFCTGNSLQVLFCSALVIWYMQRSDRRAPRRVLANRSVPAVG